MADARLRADWSRTSNLLALIANCHRDQKRRPRPFTPADFSPFGRARKGVRVSVARLADEIMRAQGSRRKG